MENQKRKIAEILLDYKSDKNFGTVKNIYNDLYRWEVVDNPEECIGHSYGESYDEIFEKFDRQNKINFLEIGIQKGGSMVAWREYFPNANLYGIDIIDCILDEYRRSDFNYIISDIKSPAVKEELKDVKFDIIIDDGSHYLSDVLFVVSNYLEKLNTGGYLIIEDCQEPENWFREINKLVSDEYELSFRDLRKHTPHSSYDNYLIVIKKK
jgi:cephalosporin hydroxylase